MAKRKKKLPAVRTKKAATRSSRLPPRIFAQASPRSVGGVSMFAAQAQIDADTVSHFMSEEEVISRAVVRLQDAGFEVLQVTPLLINIAGSAATYERAFKTRITAEERPVIKEGAQRTTAEFLDSPDTPISGLISTENTPFVDLIEGVALEEPRYFMAASAFAPTKSYWHLRVPGDVSLATNADRAHRAGITGRGIKVVMVDSGWFKHPYFVNRGYRSGAVILGPAAANPLVDESGHGTGESANAFAVAPDIDFQMVKVNFVNTIGAFNAAVGLGPHIISCSWGSSNQNGPLSAADQALAASIAAAVAAGIVVVFSAGNGHWGFPGQHPDVISAGGVFMNPDESLRASDYASGFMSNIYAGRRVPDLCGLVGMRPAAAYIMLPVEPGDNIDTSLAGGTHPARDETTATDGWAVFSGTSAAAPQLAGAAALIKQACPSLTPSEVRDILKKTARDVTTGNCSASTGGHAAIVGPDLATGDGLVDAHKAALLAKVRCLGPIIPISPRPPITPISVRPPITPIRPSPVSPITPVTPIRPITPITPPIVPIRPVGPGPVEKTPADEGQMGEGTATDQGRPTKRSSEKSSLSAQDVESLENMITQDQINLDT